MNEKILKVALVMLFCCGAVRARGAPQLQFDKTVFDFGSTIGWGMRTGSFKFKNAGTEPLKIATPTSSCGCLVAVLKKDNYAPGESGELGFTLNLGPAKAVLVKQIAVASNDPKDPGITLTVKMDYTPLYEVAPLFLSPILVRGHSTNLTVELKRNDGSPCQIGRLAASKPWITAKIDVDETGKKSPAKLRIEVKGEGPIGQLNETVTVYAVDNTNTPLAVIPIVGQLLGEVAVNPSFIYWRVTDRTSAQAQLQEAAMARTVRVSLANGEAFELGKVACTLEGVNAEVTKRDSGKAYDVRFTLMNIPEATRTGLVSFATSVLSQPTVEVPVTISVVWRPPPSGGAGQRP